ncbi:hypothetical protein [Saccharopolyspora pogona]|uniref:hypothetical protein n=1 Tax=Saccharopolyspora pogona TaxID=333966 RepID=UPI001CC25CD3|nr:hypothetical protein [Saccharopolyspora pogona]
MTMVNIDHAVQTEYSALGSPGDVQPGQTYVWGATCTDRPEIECQSQILKVAERSPT